MERNTDALGATARGSRYTGEKSRPSDGGELGQSAARSSDRLEQALRLSHRVTRSLLKELHVVNCSLAYWEAKANDPPARVRVVLFEKGPSTFFRSAFASIKALLKRISWPSASFAHRLWNNLSLMNAKQAASEMLASLARPDREALGEIQAKISALSRMRWLLAECAGRIHRASEVLTKISKGDEEEISRDEALDEMIEAFETLRSLCVQFECAEEPKYGKGVPLPNHESKKELFAKEDAEFQRTQIQFDIVLNNLHALVLRHKKPSHFERYWTLYGIIACASIYIFWRAATTPDVREMLEGIWQTSQAFWRDHVESPLTEIVDEARHALMGKEPEVSVGDLEASQRSLERMLDEYKNTWSRGGTAVWRYLNDIKPEDEMENAGLKPMELVLSRFEHEVKRPIRSLVMGDLARLLLIQTQAVKVELEGGIIGIDQVLRQQRLSLAIMALMPSLLAGLLLWTSLSAYVKHLINSRKRLERQQMRLWLAEAERALLTLQSGFGEQRIQEGFLLYALQNLSMAAHRQRGAFTPEEWRSIRVDMMELASTVVPLSSKLHTASRMGRMYDVFLPR